MLRSIIICPDEQLSQELREKCSHISSLGVSRCISHYPNEIDLLRILRAHAPEVVFLCTDSIPKACAVMTGVEKNIPGVQIIAVNRNWDQTVLIELMRSGIREILPFPFTSEHIESALQRVSQILEKKPPEIHATDLLYSFLPSKAGVGTSTIALNVSMALAQVPETEVLLADCDLNSGIIQFMLKLDHERSLIDAAEHAAHMDEDLWPQLVTVRGKLHILHSGKPSTVSRVQGAQIRYLFDFARRNYGVICADLSGNMEAYSIEIMQESKRIFIVCTPELPSLHLAREKFQLLKSLELDDRLSLLVNRWHKKSIISIEQIEQLIGVPVEMTLPNDYPGVNRAFMDGSVVQPNSELGKQFVRLAETMLNQKQAGAFSYKKRLVEYFSIFPARYSLWPPTK